MAPDSQLLEALPFAVYTTDAGGRITFYNSAAAEMWGRRPELGERWSGSRRLYRPDGQPLPHDQCPMAEALKEGRPVRGIEVVLERPDGVRIPYLPFPTPLRDETGTINGAINILIDLTDRQQGKEDSARLAAIVASSDDAIISKTLKGQITSWNAGAERIFGYDSSEMIGQSIKRIIPSELHSEEDMILSRLTNGQRVEHYETVRIAKDGRRIEVSLTASPVRDSAGRVIGASKVARDVSERKHAERTQRLLHDELNHRIKNTLATVQAIAAQTLRRAKSPTEFVASFTGRVQALGRAHALLTRASFEGAELSGLLKDQLLIDRREDPRIVCVGPRVFLNADAALHLALVMHELGTNARKHGALSAEGGRVSVHWEVQANGARQLLLNWREEGGPRVDVPSSRGFGTTMIEQSLRGHGGEVSMRYAESGVRCDIAMPLPDLDCGNRVETLHGHITQAANEFATHDRSRLSGARILIVEDEAVIAMVLGDYLVDAGCTIVGPAHALESARSLIEEMQLDAAFLDANLAGKRVDSLASALKQKGVPFAFVTGYGREGLPQGFQDAAMIEKPFTRQSVHSMLAHLLADDANVVALHPVRRSDQ